MLSNLSHQPSWCILLQASLWNRNTYYCLCFLSWTTTNVDTLQELLFIHSYMRTRGSFLLQVDTPDRIWFDYFCKICRLCINWSFSLLYIRYQMITADLSKVQKTTISLESQTVYVLKNICINRKHPFKINTSRLK